MLYTHRRLGFVLMIVIAFIFPLQLGSKGQVSLLFLSGLVSVFCPGSSPSDSNVAQWFPFSLLESVHQLPPAAPWPSKGKVRDVEEVSASIFAGPTLILSLFTSSEVHLE